MGWTEPVLCSCLTGVLVRAGFVSADGARSAEVDCCFDVLDAVLGIIRISGRVKELESNLRVLRLDAFWLL